MSFHLLQFIFWKVLQILDIVFAGILAYTLTYKTVSLFKISCVTFSSLGLVSHPEKSTILRRSCLVISFTLFYTVLQCFTLCPSNILATTHYWKVLVSSAPPYIRSWWQTSEFKSHGSCILSWTVPYFYNILHCLGENTWFLYPLLNSSLLCKFYNILHC